MKHARKMVLVDANSIKPLDNKNTDDLVEAINSLKSSNEYSRDYFGSSAVAVSYLDKELAQILERKDLDPATKLKLYTQSLNRYLFLHRTSEKTNSGIQPPDFVKPPSSHHSDSESSRPASPESFVSLSPDTIKRNRTVITPKTLKSLTPVTPRDVRTSTPVTPKELHQTRGHQSNLPRTTPKRNILREPKDRAPSRYGDYFLGWTTTRKPE